MISNKASLKLVEVPNNLFFSFGDCVKNIFTFSSSGKAFLPLEVPSIKYKAMTSTFLKTENSGCHPDKASRFCRTHDAQNKEALVRVKLENSHRINSDQKRMHVL